MKAFVAVALALVLALVAAREDLGIAPNKVYITYVDPASGNWTSPATNWDTNEVPAREAILPSTVDDVLIDNHNEVTVNIREGEHRVIRSLTIGSGNTLVIGDNGALSTGAEVESPVGFFVDSCDGIPAPCPVDWVQGEENQAFCIECALTEQVANADQTECVFCPAGKVFNATRPAGDRCQDCPMFQDTDGFGSQCRDCPAHFSSDGGEPCFECPPPTDSHSGGPCLLCLPDLREEDCPGATGGDCNGVGTCIAALDPITGAEREICDCMGQGVGPSCAFDEADGWEFNLCSGFAFDCTITVPFPFGFTRDIQITATGPIINFVSSAFNFNDIKIAWRLNHPETNYSGLGLADPFTNPPTDFEGTIFGFELHVWDEATNAPYQELYEPIIVNVPYDEFDELKNPWLLELFYYNVVQQEWIQVTRTCFGENKRSAERFAPKRIDTQSGTVEFEVYQVSGQFAVFQAKDTVTEIPGTPDGVLGPNPATPNTGNGMSGNFNGGARPPHITTGISGVLPVAPVADPGRRPAEPERRPLFTASSATRNGVSVVGALLLLVILLVL